MRLVELIREGGARAVNMYPRCVTPQGNRNAQAQLWRVFRTVGADDHGWVGLMAAALGLAVATFFARDREELRQGRR